jgi:hypothetical protein
MRDKWFIYCTILRFGFIEYSYLSVILQTIHLESSTTSGSSSEGSADMREDGSCYQVLESGFELYSQTPTSLAHKDTVLGKIVLVFK